MSHNTAPGAACAPQHAGMGANAADQANAARALLRAADQLLNALGRGPALAGRIHLTAPEAEALCEVLYGANPLNVGVARVLGRNC